MVASPRMDVPLRDPTADAALRAVATMPARTALAVAFRDALARPWRSVWLADCVRRCLREAEA